MKRLAIFLSLAVAGFLSCGCISPVVVKSIGPAKLVSPIEHEPPAVVRNFEGTLASPEAAAFEPARIAFQRLPTEAGRGTTEETPTLRRAKPLSEISLD